MALTLALLLSVFVTANPANADDGGYGGLNQGAQSYTPSAHDQALIMKKQCLADELQQVRQGKLALATYKSDVAAFYQQLGTKHTTSPSVLPNCIEGCTPPPTYYYLLVQQISQIKTYYCGPGSAESVLKFLGHDTSQTTLASDTYLHTETDGGTNYGSNVMAPTLNTIASTGGFYN